MLIDIEGRRSAALMFATISLLAACGGPEDGDESPITAVDAPTADEAATDAIVGGALNTFAPEVVALAWEGTATSHCSGVLVARNLVLTAGHCLENSQIPGESGRWDSSAPTFRPMPLFVEPLAGWDCGLRGGPTLTEQYINPHNYRQTEEATSAACATRCNGESRCAGWTYQRSTRRCFLKRVPTIQVRFGTTLATPTYITYATEHSFPGRADMVMLRLEADVPSSVATPAPVIAHLPPSQPEVRSFLSRHTFMAVGSTSRQTTQRQLAMTFNSYPHLDPRESPPEDIAVALMSSGVGSIEPADSGSPLFVQKRLRSGVVQRFVIGVLQGGGGSSATYTLTGINLSRRGVYLTFPYSPAAVDRRLAAPIGEWMNNVLYADFRARFPNVLPLANWYGGTDNFLSSDPRWTSDPRGVAFDGAGRLVDPPRQQDGYLMYRQEGYLFHPRRPQPTGTVPLFSWFNPTARDNFASSEPQWTVPVSSLVWSGEALVGGPTRSGWTMYRLEGFVFDPRASQPAGTRPLFRWYNATTGDNFTTTDPRFSIPMSSVRWRGDLIEPVATVDGYTVVRLEGFVSSEPR